MHVLRGSAAFLLLAVNSALLCTCLYAIALLRLWPSPALLARVRRWMHATVDAWVAGNRHILRGLGVTRIAITGTGTTRRDRWYLLLCNHQCWADILVLQCGLLESVPVLKFFMKRVLVWVPFIGLACWALDFPFLYRHARAALERHPHLRAQDLEATRRACAHFRDTPTAILNFTEGTRFTPAKRAAQASPYRHLLKPKAGGFAFVLDALGDRIDEVLDVTIAYAGGAPTFWQFLCGRGPRVDVHVDVLRVPRELAGGDYAGDERYRAAVGRWLADRWQRKDMRLAAGADPAAG
jgi:1-acyl-sn-glycerol-3-phosphate acyltransferase